jgi:hypothetical protein
MNRRDLIALLGTTAATWPLGVYAQQQERMRRIGVLTPLAEVDPEGQVRISAFLKALQQLGWTDGSNLRIDYRRTLGDAERTQRGTVLAITLYLGFGWSVFDWFFGARNAVSKAPHCPRLGEVRIVFGP